ncbi:hypothetical protein HPB47_024888, partial [Ixodes persulcatus]
DKFHFFIKWKGWSPKFNSWEPEESVAHCMALVISCCVQSNSSYRFRLMRSAIKGVCNRARPDVMVMSKLVGFEVPGNGYVSKTQLADIRKTDALVEHYVVLASADTIERGGGLNFVPQRSDAAEKFNSVDSGSVGHGRRKATSASSLLYGTPRRHKLSCTKGSCQRYELALLAFAAYNIRSGRCLTSRTSACPEIGGALWSWKNFLELVEARKEQAKVITDWEEYINKASEERCPLFVENYVDLETPPTPNDFVYLKAVVSGRRLPARPGIVFPEEPEVGCQCTDCYSGKEQCCPQLANTTFMYNRHGTLVVNRGGAIWECNSRCKCSNDCPNRVVQKGRQVPLTIFRTTNKRGWGVRTERRIKKGTFLFEYFGEVITNEEAEQRGRTYDAQGITYLFDLDYDDSDDNFYTVDAGKCGNVSHFVNHSVKENLSRPKVRRRFVFLRKGGYAQVVLREPAPLMVAVGTQTSFLDYRRPLQSPTPQLKIQLPGHVISAGRSTDPPSQSANPRAPTGQQPVSSQAVFQTQDGPVAAATVPLPRSLSREKGRHSRPHSLERASSKERHGSRAAPAAPKRQERANSGDAPPSTSSAPLAGAGRGRGMVPHSPSLPKPAAKASPQEAEAMDEGTEVSTHASEQDDMEWQTSKIKHKHKKPVIPPK